MMSAVKINKLRKSEIVSSLTKHVNFSCDYLNSNQLHA